MKRLLLIVCLFPMILFGQEIKFMGLDLNSNLDSFCKELEKKGLKKVVDRFEEKEFIGTFATYDSCRIYVTATEVSKKIKRVEVAFNAKNDKIKRDKIFDELIQQYSNKYKSKLKKIAQDPKNNPLNITSYIISTDNVSIRINKFGPGLFLNTSSLNILYDNLLEIDNNEKNPNRYSNDI